MSKYKPPRFLPRHKLLRILRRLGCVIDASKGAGSHFGVWRDVPGVGRLIFILPYHRDYGHDYLKPLRENLRLRPEDGISDRDFYEA